MLTVCLQSNCELMRPIFESAGARIASVIKFRDQIDVKVEFTASINQGIGQDKIKLLFIGIIFNAKSIWLY